VTTWQNGTNLLNKRFQTYLGTFWALALSQRIAPGFNNGSVFGTSLSEGPTAANMVLNLVTSISGGSISPQFSPQPLGANQNEANITNVPAYVWMPITVPSNAVSMSFDYMIQGNWQSDSLAVALERHKCSVNCRK